MGWKIILNWKKKKFILELVLKHHPDKNGGAQSSEYLDIRSAWETLSFPVSRKLYDAELSNRELSQDSTLWCELKLEELRDTILLFS